MNNNKTYHNVLKISQEQKKKLEDELYYLVHVEWVKVLNQLQSARDKGDLSENADYDSAKKYQSEVETRILQIRSQLKNSEIITDKTITHTKVDIGSIIKFQYINFNNNKIETVKIVGAFEDDILGEIKKLSYESLFASSLMKYKNKITPGLIIQIPAHKNKYKIKILEVKF